MDELVVGEVVAAALEVDLVVEDLVVGLLQDVGLEVVTLKGEAVEKAFVPVEEGNTLGNVRDQ